MASGTTTIPDADFQVSVIAAQASRSGVSDTANTLTDFDLCVALAQKAIDTQMSYAWKAWKRRSDFKDSIDLFEREKDGQSVPSKYGIDAVLAPLTVSLNVPDGRPGQVHPNPTSARASTLDYLGVFGTRQLPSDRSRSRRRHRRAAAACCGSTADPSHPAAARPTLITSRRIAGHAIPSALRCRCSGYQLPAAATVATPCSRSAAICRCSGLARKISSDW